MGKYRLGQAIVGSPVIDASGILYAGSLDGIYMPLTFSRVL